MRVTAAPSLPDAPADTPYVGLSFRDVYDQHYANVVKVLVMSGVTRAGAEDIAQDAFAVAYPRWARVSIGTNPAGYVYKIAFRLARRRPKRDERQVEPPARNHADEASAIALRLDVRSALAELPRRQRECVLLRHVLGFSTVEVARSLRLRESTVRSHLAAARASLSRGLEARTTSD